MFLFGLMSVRTKLLARYIVPSPHEQPSAKLTTHFTCGARLLIAFIARDMQRLSELRGSTSSNAMRFSSRKLLHPVPSTSPMSLLLSIGGPKDITPCSRPSRNAPKCRHELLTTLPL